jgi:hypothetical protein
LRGDFNIDGVSIEYVVCRRDPELIAGSVAIGKRLRRYHNLLGFGGLSDLNYGAVIDPSIFGSKWDTIVG